jgi:co-chaperonin GroES (HSP10)
MPKFPIRPSGTIVMCKKISEPLTSPGGLLLPTNDPQMALYVAEVVATGRGHIGINGVIPMDIKVGDVVVTPKMSSMQLQPSLIAYLQQTGCELDLSEYFAVQYEHIICVLNSSAPVYVPIEELPMGRMRCNNDDLQVANDDLAEAFEKEPE